MSETVLHDLRWSVSSYCTSNNCIEVADSGSTIMVRDSKNPETALHYSVEEWRDFLEGVKNGDFA